MYNVHMHTQTYTHTCTYVNIQYTHTHTHTQKLTYMYAYNLHSFRLCVSSLVIKNLLFCVAKYFTQIFVRARRKTPDFKYYYSNTPLCVERQRFHFNEYKFYEFLLISFKLPKLPRCKHYEYNG